LTYLYFTPTKVGKIKNWAAIFFGCQFLCLLFLMKTKGLGGYLTLVDHWDGLPKSGDLNTRIVLYWNGMQLDI
jgi:hypothetical protein